VKFSLKHDDGTEFGFYLAAGHATFVEIFDQKGAVKQWGGDNAPLRSHVGSHYHHFCLEILGLEEFCTLVQKRGGTIDRPVKVGMDHSKQAWIRDPDGNVIELMEYTPRSLQL